MKRYCSTCKVYIEVTLDDRRANEVCVVCGGLNVHFNLHQRLWLSNNVVESAQVRRIMFNRGGQTGSVMDKNLEGVSLDFFGPAPSFEFWNWNELEVAHLLPDDMDGSIGLPPLREDFSAFAQGGWIMYVDGSVAHVSQRGSGESPGRLLLFGFDTWAKRKTVGPKDIKHIVDWLPDSVARNREARIA